MRKARNLSAGALIVGLMVGVASAASLKSVSGNVLISAPTGLKSGTIGMTLASGSRILTTSSGAAVVRIDANCEVSLGANQRLTIPAGGSCEQVRAAVEGVNSRLVAGSQVVPSVVNASTRRSTVTIDASTLFVHNKYQLADTLAAGRASLDELSRKIDAECTGVERIMVEGHADITNSTGDPAYNDRLSLARAVTVRDYLTTRGKKSYPIEAIGFGHSAPVKTSCVYPKGAKLSRGGLAQGSASASDMNALLDCLQPNRRVVVRIEGNGLVCGIPPVAAAQPPVPPPAAPVVVPPPPVVAAPAVVAPVIPPAAVVPAAATAGFPGATILGGVGAAGLGYYIYDRNRRNTSPN
jgi:outer membrane protein OmpA-like peptidoglycan-associated protein